MLVLVVTGEVLEWQLAVMGMLARRGDSTWTFWALTAVEVCVLLGFGHVVGTPLWAFARGDQIWLRAFDEGFRGFFTTVPPPPRDKNGGDDQPFQGVLCAP